MENETLIDDLVARWEELHDRGTPVAIEEVCVGSPGLVDEVRRRVEALQAVDSALDTAAYEILSRAGPGDPNGPGATKGVSGSLRATALYRALRHHDGGGLGVVFTAYQEELARTVAVKRIRPDKMREASRRRFLREAVLTARLQHPGIVPIYDLGHDADGPFYTMPLIRGRTFQDAIEAFHGEEGPHGDAGPRALRFRGLLQQFTAACNTVAYAHDQEVLHRDLKPSNIMLGPYGETLVMDWGLAKLSSRGEAASEDGGEPASTCPTHDDVTATGEVLGTPRYMSPEQARGEPAGPAGDIFSLGLILYAILTGRSAFDESSFRGPDRLKAVRDAAVVPPRKRDPHLPRSLEAICMKALAARAADRYPSARALAEDLTRWLADEPVSAWREPIGMHVRRWGRRHRTAVMAVVAAMLAGLVGLGAVVAEQGRSNARLEGALQQTRLAQAHTQAALEQSEESRTQAMEVSKFLVEVFRSPDPAQDGRQVKVVDLLDRAGAQLDDSFRGSPTTRGALLDTLGWTYHGLGLFDRAVGLLARAGDARQAALGRDHPDTLATRTNLATALASSGRFGEAIALHRETLEHKKVKLGPDHPGTLASRMNLAIVYDMAGHLDEAIALHAETLAIKARTLGPDHVSTIRSRLNLATVYQEAGRLDEAIALHEGTIALCETTLGPDHPLALGTRNNLAAAYDDAGRMGEAIALYRSTLARKESSLGPDHPDTLQSRGNLATAYAEIGRLSEAITLFEALIGRMESGLGLDHPDILETRRNLATAYGELGRWSEAEALYRETVGRRRKVVEPDSPLLAADLAEFAHHLLERSRWSQAEPRLRECLAIREKATADDWTRFDAMSLLGGALLGLGRPAEAEPLVVAGYVGMKGREPRIPFHSRSRLREAGERVVRLYETAGRPDKAADWKARVGMPDLPAVVFARP